MEDSNLDDDGRAAEVARLIALGATRLWDGRQGPHEWVTLADPEGNELRRLTLNRRTWP